MADKIKKSDLFGDLSLSSEIAALKELLGLVEKLQAESQKMAKNKLSEVMKVDASTAEGVKKLMTAREQSNAIEKQSNELDKEAIKLKKQLKEAEDEEVKAKIRYQEASKLQKQSLRDELILADKNAGTLTKLAAKNRQLRREREGLNLETAKGKARLAEINAELDRNNKRIISNSDALKKQRMNVGNYTQSVTEGIQASGLFSRQLMMLQRIQATLAAFKKKTTAETEAQTVATKGATAASGGFTKALKLVRIALISTGIGAIVVALGSLIAAFASTQRGADAFTKVLRPLSTIFQRFIGFLQDTAFVVFDRLKEAFSDPKQAVMDLGNAIKENLVNRFKAVGVFGSAIAKLFKGEFAEGFTELGDAAVQLTTGVTDASSKLQGLADDIGEGVSESVKQGEQLDNLIKKFEQRQIDLAVPIAQAKLEFQRLREIAQDQTKSDEERIKALEEAEKRQRFIANAEQELLDLKIERMELEQSFNDTSREEELELQNLKVERLQAEERAQKKINGLVSLRTGIELRAEKQLEAQAKKKEKAAETQAKKDKAAADKKAKEAADKAKKEAEAQAAIDKELAQVRQQIEQEQFAWDIELLEKELEAKKELGDLELEEEQRLIDQIRDKKVKALEDELAFQIEAIEKEIEDKELRDAKIEQLEAEHERKVQRLNEETADKKKELDKEATKEAIDNAKKVFAESKKIFDQSLSNREDILNKELEQSKSQEAELIALAENGVDFAEKSLAVERAKQAEIQKELQKTEQRKQLLKTAETALELMASYAEGGSSNPFQDAFSDVTKMLAAIKNIQFFADGTESVTGGIQGKDSVPAMLMPKERVVDVENNMKIGSMSNDDLANLAFKYRTGGFDSNLPAIKVEKARFESNQQLIQRVMDVEKAVKNIPQVSIDAHAMANFITETIRRQNKVDRKHYKSNEIFK